MRTVSTMSYYHEYMIPSCTSHHLQQKQQAASLARETHKNSSPSKSSKPKPDNTIDTMISGMAPALFLGQCFSLLAVSNAVGGRSPVFRWISLRVLFSTVVSLMLATHCVLLVSYILSRNEMTLAGSQVAVFYLSSFIASCLYVRLASQWASLCAAFEAMENRISVYGNSSGLRRRMRTITAVVLIFALVEHILSQIDIYTTLESTVYRRSGRGWLESLYFNNFHYMTLAIPFSPFIAVETIVVNLVSTFVWNYNDLFIMLISVAISWRFRLLNNALIQTAHQDKDAKSWRQSRETFNEISSLTRTVDSCLSLHVFLSFVNNFYFICMQLLHTVRYENNSTYKNIYVTFSFGFLVSRTAAVSLFASSVYEESRECKRVLYAVSSESYCEEVSRFLYQVTTDEIALTGANFFKITRSLLLTVVGTITTYEVVLIQFNGLNSNG